MDKLHWYFNRFRLMSVPEVGYRVKAEVSKRWDLVFLKDYSPDVSLKQHSVHWYFDSSEKERLLRYLSNNDLWNQQAADDALAHKFSFFSLDGKEVGNDINWHCDYKNSHVSPLKFAKSIDYRDFNEVGDFKYIWEINRHQHLITLAKAYYVTGNVAYKEEVREQVLGWIADNPYMQGVNWTSALELGVRLISWSWAWTFVDEMDDEWRSNWLACIYKHCDVISRSFSHYSSANNHLVGEAAGLYIASIAWPFHVRSETWRKKSFDILVEEMDKQNYEDGVNKEQTTSYQQFVLDFFLLSGLLGEKNGDSFPAAYWERLQRMIEFLASIMNSSGQVPAIGDSDDGYAVILSENQDFDPFKSLMATGAAVFKQGGLTERADLFDEKSLWLLGLAGADAFKRLPRRAFEPKRKFPEGGYYLLGTGFGTDSEVLCVFDCGPLGYLSLAAHGHADALSFTLSISGKEFFIDPGTFVYQYPKEWRNYFRGTSAHNTIRINRTDQSTIGGNFMWLTKAKSTLVAFESNSTVDRVCAKHAGYQRLKNKVTHEREITFSKQENVVKIVDRLTAQGTYLAEQFFHLGGSCEVKEISPCAYEISNDGTHVLFELDRKLSPFLAKACTAPIAGWHSPRFDVREPSWTVGAENQFQGDIVFETFIHLAL